MGKMVGHCFINVPEIRITLGEEFWDDGQSKEYRSEQKEGMEGSWGKLRIN